MIIRVWLTILCTGLLSCVTTSPFASQHNMTQKIFEVQSQTLHNGLHIIRHHRNDSDTFSAQLIVELGLQDFDCENKQAPHLLEHMVFEGSKQFDRKALRQRIRNHGGDSRAFTVEEYTHFTLNVHSDYPEVALENLHSMMTESLLEESSFQTSQQIIHAEQGTTSNRINPLWSSASILTNAAKAQLYSGSELYCRHLSNPDAVSLKDITELYRLHYVASNMTLILLGHFDDQKVDAILKRTFAAMKKVTKPSASLTITPSPDYTPIREKRDVLDPQAELYMLIPAEGERHTNSEAYELISEYLGEQLYYQVRGEKGLGYTPRARLISNSHQGIIQATTRTTDQMLPEAEAAFLEVYSDLLESSIPKADIERLKRKLILQFESKQRDHSALAQLYRHHRQAIQSQGEMPNLVKAIAQVNGRQIREVLSGFPSQPLIATLARPPITRVLLYIIMISVIATTLAWPLLRWVRKQQHK